MSKKQYTHSQQQELQENIYVEKVSEKYITFTDTCRQKALDLDIQGVYFRDIFSSLGFPEYIVHSEVPKICLKRWRRKYRQDWVLWLVRQKQWRKEQNKQDTSNMNLEEHNEYLQAENAYLRELLKYQQDKYP